MSESEKSTNVVYVITSETPVWRRRLYNLLFWASYAFIIFISLWGAFRYG